jgi:molybdopterin-guanine dinucleotide biosynthesis protein A
MPFLSIALLRRMAELAPGCDAVVPWLGSGPVPASVTTARAQDMHPLHAIYSRACLPAIERALAGDDLHAIAFFADVHVCYLPPDDIDRIDPGRRSFMNLNTSDDLVIARRLLGESA